MAESSFYRLYFHLNVNILITELIMMGARSLKVDGALINDSLFRIIMEKRDLEIKIIERIFLLRFLVEVKWSLDSKNKLPKS